MRTVRRSLVVLLALTAALVTLAGPANAAGDDYRWRTDTTQSADTWGFTRRQCTSFAGWRLNQRGKAISTRMGFGNALNWDEVARRRGVVVTTAPRVGSIAQWNAYEKSTFYANGSTRPNGWMQAGSYGHVAYVAGVYSDGSVKIEQYNMNGTRAYSTARVKAPRYLRLS